MSLSSPSPAENTSDDSTVSSISQQDQTRSGAVLSKDRAAARAEYAVTQPLVLEVESLRKVYDTKVAVNDVNFSVHAGSLTGLVGLNGAGKTTTLSIISGLNKPSYGRVTVDGVDVWGNSATAKRLIGSLPDRLRIFDRLTGSQFLYYMGVLHGLKRKQIAVRASELAEVLGLSSALDRMVSDYSVGMQKKISLAASLIHSPKILVLDEPFEAIDPVSAANVTDILEQFVAGGGSVLISSHSIETIGRVCDHVVIIEDGEILAKGTVAEVAGERTLDQRFRELVKSPEEREQLAWLQGFWGSV